MFFKKPKILHISRDVRLTRAYKSMQASIKRELGSDADHEAYFTLATLFCSNVVTGNYHLSPKEAEVNAQILYAMMMEAISDLASQTNEKSGELQA